MCINSCLRIDNCDEWSDYKEGDIFGLKAAISINDISIENPDFSRHNIAVHLTRIKGMMNLKPIFPILFFDPRFLIYYSIYLFKILQTCSYIHLKGTVSQILLMQKNGKI